MDTASSPNSSEARSDRNVPAPRVLITAGPTHEPIDRVRYIGNRSSGRMGIALAKACLDRGWPVTLLLGPLAANGISPPTHPQLQLLRFQTAAELQTLLHNHWPTHDLLLMAAAVADFTVANPGKGKIKRAGEQLQLELTATPDLLASLAPITRPDQRVVGFALEPAANLVADARSKLKRKKLDAIVANPLETMESTAITASLVLANEAVIESPTGMLKEDFAKWLLDHVSFLIKR